MPATDAGTESERLAKLRVQGLITASEYQVLSERLLLPGEGAAGPEPDAIAAVAAFPPYDEYRTKTTREIVLFVAEPK